MPRHRLLPAALVVLLAVCAALSFRHLAGDDRLFVIDTPLPGVGARVAAPGWRFAPWLLYRVSSYPADPVRQRIELAGDTAARTREGARVDLDVEVTWAIHPDSAAEAPRLARPRFPEVLAAGSGG